MRSSIVLAGAVAAALAIPGNAAAAGTISGGPAKAGGYHVTLHAVDAREDALTITMTRGTARAGDSEALTVSSGVRVTVRGRSASIKGSLGSRGAVDLRLRDARKQTHGSSRSRCTSTGASYAGRLSGKLRLKLPGGRWVTIRSMTGQAYTGGKVTCKSSDDRPGGDGGDGGGDSRDDEPRLMLTMNAEGVQTMFMAERRLLMVTRMTPERRERGATIQVASAVYATGSNLLRVSDGGARAAVASAGPFTGNGAFTRTEGAGPYATGPLTGSLAVKLSGVPIRIAGDDAILMNGDKA